MENNPEKFPEYVNENTEKQLEPNQENVIIEKKEEVEPMSQEEKDKALESLKSELSKEYDHVGPNAEWGADDVVAEKGIVKKERSHEVEIQPREEFLEQYLKTYMDQKFPNEVINESGDEGKGELEKFSDEMIEKSLSGQDVSKFSREDFLEEYLDKYSKKFKEEKSISQEQEIKDWAERIENLKEKYGENWDNELRKEMDNEKFKNESEQTREKIREFDEKYSVKMESSDELNDSKTIKSKDKEKRGMNRVAEFVLDGLGSIGTKFVEFIMFLPARWYDATVFLYNLAEAILDGKVSNFLDKEIKNRMNKKKAQMEKVFYGG
ncbi:MAG TPA: hypothetical protein PLA41_02080 [Candidatus Pacearchaeota archaeon]|nr:hypothetical protein [Candidatus Parcubacteria bacterium]HOU45916.1 hypothetical protein [Candidatus Pacearchaeota archaeon]HPM08209.1 hypothetical protein [Candidatus Pacearchaeota archaeon]HQI74471.1 hypothetical protein [Candidatus Pacearchaeota archaeon]